MESVDLNQIVRIGTISSIDPSTATARVLFEDRDDQVSFDLSLLFSRTKGTQDYFTLEVGEEVVCLFRPNALEEGYILGAYYNKNKPETIPENNEHKRLVKFKDGTLIEYDSEQSKLTIESNGAINVTASSINIKAPNINIEADINVIGNIKVSGSIIDTTGNTSNHSH